MANKTKLGGSSATFANMMDKGFGIVTVMNAKIYDIPSNFEFKTKVPEDILAEFSLLTPVCELDTLKVANVTQEGPTKTVTGGQYSNPLIKFGKSARLEMQDALGNAKAIDALCGGIREYDGTDYTVGLHFGEDFGGPKTIIGDSFFIDRTTGQQVKVKIIFYQFLPDSIFNLTQDAEGDATVFDMNGDLLTTNIQLKDNAGSDIIHGVFYSILPDVPVTNPYFTMATDVNTGEITLTAKTGYDVTVDGSSNTLTIESGHAAKVVVKQNNIIVFTTVIVN